MKIALIFVILFSMIACYASFDMKPLLCKKLMKPMKNYQQMFRITDVMKVLYNLQSKMCKVKAFKKRCKFFDGRVRTVLKLLHQKSNGYLVCNAIAKFNNVTICNHMTSSNTTLLCEGCETVVAVIKFDLDVLKYSAKTIKNGIQALCDLLAPLKIQKTLCKDITDYIDDIINWIINGTSQEKICEKLKLCPKQTTFLSKTKSVPWKKTYDSNKVVTYDSNKVVHPHDTKCIPWKNTQVASKVKAGQPYDAKSIPWKSTKESKKLKFVKIGK